MKIKYPKSWHLPYSEKPTSGDRKHSNDDHFLDKEVVVTIKMDGENTSIYNDTIHARSLDSGINSEDRRWIDALRSSKIEGNLPKSVRLCGENMFYRHTCEYNNLQSMFYLFSVWKNDICMSWYDTEKWANKLGLKHVPVIYKGIYDRSKILKAFDSYNKKTKDDVEGFVVRLSSSFTIEDFPTSLNKYVNSSFQIGDNHWRHSAKTLNQLVNNENIWDSIWK